MSVDFGFVNPEELRHWAREDLYGVNLVRQARPLVQAELARRIKERQGETDGGKGD